MSTSPNNQIDGNVSVSRNATIGGNATVNGSATFGHNVRVEGWLEAPNVKGYNKGLFSSDQRLKELYPHPKEGWTALVGNSLPADLWMVDERGQWYKSGTKAGTVTFAVDKLERSVQDVWLTDGTDEMEHAAPTLSVRYNNGDVKVDGMLMAGDANGGMLRKTHFKKFNEAAGKVEALSADATAVKTQLEVTDKRSRENGDALQKLKTDMPRVLSYVWIANGTEDNAQLGLCFRLISGEVVRAGIPLASASNTTAGMLSYKHWQEFRGAVSGVADLRRDFVTFKQEVERVSASVNSLAGSNAERTLANYRAIEQIMADAETKETFMYSLTQFTRQVDALDTRITALGDSVDQWQHGFMADYTDLNETAATLEGKFAQTMQEFEQARKELASMRDDAASVRMELLNGMDDLRVAVKEQMGAAEVYFRKMDALESETLGEIAAAKAEMNTSLSNTLAQSAANVEIVQQRLSDHNLTIEELRTQTEGLVGSVEARVEALESVHEEMLTDADVDEMVNTIIS